MTQERRYLCVIEAFDRPCATLRGLPKILPRAGRMHAFTQALTTMGFVEFIVWATTRKPKPALEPLKICRTCGRWGAKRRPNGWSECGELSVAIALNPDLTFLTPPTFGCNRWTAKDRPA